MKHFLLAIFLGATATFRIHAETERTFFARTIDALPKASAGEFKTPESPARFFVQAIIEGRTSDTFKCVPLSRLFAADTFENKTRYLGNIYSPDMGVPDDDYGRYLKLLSSEHYLPVQKCRIKLLFASSPSATNLVERIQKPEDESPAAVSKWVEKLSRDLSFQNLTNATISSVTSEPRKGELKHLGVVPFKDIHFVTIHVSVRGSDVPFTFLVGLVDENYQIHSLVD